MFTDYSVNQQFDNNYPVYSDEDRFFLAPFLFGGLAGTALGYGIANNNQLNNQPYYPMVPMYPVYPMYPTPYTTYSSNNYYY